MYVHTYIHVNVVNCEVHVALFMCTQAYPLHLLLCPVPLQPPLSTADSSSSILIQLVGALRNLSDNISLREEFITHGVIAGLCGLLGRYSHDGDLMFVVSRLFR